VEGVESSTAAALASVVSVLVTSAFGLWVARVNARQAREAKNRELSGTDHDRLLQNLWKLYQDAEERAKAYQGECETLRKAVETIGLDNRLNDIQTTIQARRIVAHFPSWREKFEGELAIKDAEIETLRAQLEKAQRQARLRLLGPGDTDPDDL
jgi:hypothetical protein